MYKVTLSFRIIRGRRTTQQWQAAATLIGAVLDNSTLIKFQQFLLELPFYVGVTGQKPIRVKRTPSCYAIQLVPHTLGNRGRSIARLLHPANNICHHTRRPENFNGIVHNFD